VLPALPGLLWRTESRAVLFRRQSVARRLSDLALAVAAGLASLGVGGSTGASAVAAGIAFLVGLIAIGGRFIGLANLTYL
jgi:hypothetical protein